MASLHEQHEAAFAFEEHGVLAGPDGRQYAVALSRARLPPPTVHMAMLVTNFERTHKATFSLQYVVSSLQVGSAPHGQRQLLALAIRVLARRPVCPQTTESWCLGSAFASTYCCWLACRTAASTLTRMLC